MPATTVTAVTAFSQKLGSKHAVAAVWIAITRSILGNRSIVQLGNDQEVRVIGI